MAFFSSASPETNSFLKVYAATSYDKAELVPVPVNQTESSSSDKGYLPKVVDLESDLVKAKVAVNLQDFKEHDDPKDESSPLRTTTSTYFSHPLHKYDRLSIQISVAFKKDGTGDSFIYGDDLLWGNDFDESIKDQLPYGSGVGLNIMKHTVDPSIEGDIYCDKPYLYGSALSSFNKVHVSKTKQLEDGDFEVVWPGIITTDNFKIDVEESKEEAEPKDNSTPDSPKSRSSSTESLVKSLKSIRRDSSPSSGTSTPKSSRSWRSSKSDQANKQPQSAVIAQIPTDSVARSKYFLKEVNRHDYQVQLEPAQYSFDFYTPYLDLGKEFAIKLPGFSLNVEKYAKSQPLRFTLKNKKTGKVYLVVVFELHKNGK